MLHVEVFVLGLGNVGPGLAVVILILVVGLVVKFAHFTSNWSVDDPRNAAATRAELVGDFQLPQFFDQKSRSRFNECGEDFRSGWVRSKILLDLLLRFESDGVLYFLFRDA